MATGRVHLLAAALGRWRGVGRGVGVWMAPAPAQPTTGPAPSRAAVRDRRDERRFRELMLPHLDAAYSLARYLLTDPSAAEDVVQEAYLRAYRAFPGYRGGEAKAWLLTIVRHAAFSWRKAERTRRAVVGDSHGFGDSTVVLEQIGDPDQDSAETTLVRAGETARVRRAIAALPDPFRETVILRELEALSYREIAALTDAPIGTVMSRLARARTLLAQALGVDGDTAEDRA